ncbi:hypothetical protein RRG08_029002 [Elysia crispata]|uniref:Uncharacterized protein n=1 Tax=Elysia crispata TaxID=231223 RepID=A0AAE1BBP1_9GAST|nr:hypothetical protein RRG08_029002 [Elysia crispata]
MFFDPPVRKGDGMVFISQKRHKDDSSALVCLLKCISGDPEDESGPVSPLRSWFHLESFSQQRLQVPSSIQTELLFGVETTGIKGGRRHQTDAVKKRKKSVLNVDE